MNASWLERLLASSYYVIRQAQALEIARMVVSLASEESSFMTGSILTVDGGCTATFNHGSA